MRCVLLGLGIGMTLMPFGLKAQQRLAPGDSILVTYVVAESGPTAVADGTFRGVSAGSILVVERAPGDTLSIPYPSLAGLQVYRPAHSGAKLAFIGAVRRGIRIFTS